MKLQDTPAQSAAIILPTFTWEYVIKTLDVYVQGSVVSSDVHGALDLVLSMGHFDADTLIGDLGAKPEELHLQLDADLGAVESVLEIPSGTITLKKRISSDWERLNNMASYLRQEYRIKQNVDYCFAFKQGQLNILCTEVYEDLLREACAKHSFAINSIHTY